MPPGNCTGFMTVMIVGGGAYTSLVNTAS